jgi:hypothetical protein
LAVTEPLVLVAGGRVTISWRAVRVVEVEADG